MDRKCAINIYAVQIRNENTAVKALSFGGGGGATLYANKLSGIICLTEFCPPSKFSAKRQTFAPINIIFFGAKLEVCANLACHACFTLNIQISSLSEPAFGHGAHRLSTVNGESPALYAEQS